MFKKLQLTIFAAMVMSCSVTYGQAFTPITPSSLGLVQGAGPVTGTFNIGDQFGLAPSAVQLLIGNANVNAGVDLFTVAEGENASFNLITTPANVDFEAFVSHGPVLGGGSQTGSAPVDGFFATPGETFTLVSSLDSGFVTNVTGNNNNVTFTGPAGGPVQQNSSAFRFESDQPVSSFIVFTQNTNTFDSNFSFGFRPTEAIPEPTAAVVLAFGSTLCLIRRKRN